MKCRECLLTIERGECRSHNCLSALKEKVRHLEDEEYIIKDIRDKGTKISLVEKYLSKDE